MTARPTLFINARIVDPATGRDGGGELLVHDGIVARAGVAAADALVVDCDGHALMPGLIDLRVSTGEPGSEHRETLKTAGLAAVAGGVTTMVVQPDTDPVIDSAAMIDFIARRGRDRSPARVLAAGACTRGLNGREMAEIGLMDEAGAVMFANGAHPVASARVMARILSYARAFGALVASRPQDADLAEGTVMHAGELASRLGLAGNPVAAEVIGAARDIELAALTGGRLLLDMISAAATLERLEQARRRGVDVCATVSVHHLTLNEQDVDGYRTFAKLAPPLRREQDRIALVEGLRTGQIEAIVSGHDPRPAEDKRLPFDEASFGASALETLLPAALRLYHNGDLELVDLIRPLTSGPAGLLGLETGTLAPGAPADLILVDLGYPVLFDAARMRSKSRNSPFDGQKLQGRVLGTWVGGNRVFTAD
jgi:dihydroorotase